jgi:cell division protein FtsI (penicillin-binding protein 3)
MVEADRIPLPGGDTPPPGSIRLPPLPQKTWRERLSRPFVECYAKYLAWYRTPAPPRHNTVQVATHRARWIVMPVLFVFLALSARVLQIHLGQGEAWSKVSERQRFASERQPAPRGEIRGSDGSVLVCSLPKKIVFADLKLLKDVDAAAKALAPLLERTSADLLARMGRNDRRVVYLARDIEPGQAQKIAALKIRGIGFEEDYDRGYLWGTLACHVVGWSGMDGGMEGLELSLDPLLRGIPGYRVYERDAARRPLCRGTDEDNPQPEFRPRAGVDVTLTVHPELQFVAEEELAKVVASYRPLGATAIVMDVGSGAILAMACLPKFDPNEPAESPTAARRNRALTDCYEPGSTFKTFIAAMALDRRVCSRRQRFDCENGAWRVGYRTLHDAHAYGTLDFDHVIIKSSNIGAAKIGMALGLDGVYGAVTAFGFGSKTRIDLPGEARGLVRPRSRLTKDSLLSVPMGQEIAVTPLQLVTAYTAMVNGGILFRPQIIQRLVNAEGKELYRLRPQPVRRVISPETSAAMREMLQDVVEEGTARKAWCKEYAIGGKTGTAQKVIGGMYSHDKYVGSFCGFAPAESPRLVCLVTVDEPDRRLGYYGGTVAAPAVREILRRGLNALGVPPRTAVQQEQAESAFRQTGTGGGD